MTTRGDCAIAGAGAARCPRRWLPPRVMFRAPVLPGPLPVSTQTHTGGSARRARRTRPVPRGAGPFLGRDRRVRISQGLQEAIVAVAALPLAGKQEPEPGILARSASLPAAWRRPRRRAHRTALEPRRSKFAAAARRASSCDRAGAERPGRLLGPAASLLDESQPPGLARPRAGHPRAIGCSQAASTTRGSHPQRSASRRPRSSRSRPEIGDLALAAKRRALVLATTAQPFRSTAATAQHPSRHSSPARATASGSGSPASRASSVPRC